MRVRPPGIGAVRALPQDSGPPVLASAMTRRHADPDPPATPATAYPGRRRARRSLLLALLAPVLPACAAGAPRPPAAPPAMVGVSLDVQDGDTFEFRGRDGRRTRVRLAGIDAPERNQPYADQSRRLLGELLRGATVRLEPIKPDPYGRLVAGVWVRRGEPQEVDVSLVLLRAGLAWHFTRYRADQTAESFDRYAEAQREARAARRGLWRTPEPEAPWDFRERTRRRPAGPAPPAPRPSAG
jgi:micrococcal nuclease